MDQGPLVIDQIDAGIRFLAEFQRYVPIQAAFWIKESGEDAWNLYVASDKITDDNFDEAYGEVLRIAGVLSDPHFDPFQVKLIGLDDPLAKAALDIHRRYPGPLATRFHGKVFGGTPVEEVYVYSASIPVPAK